MEKDVFHVFFVGDALSHLSGIRFEGIKTEYYSRTDEFFRHIEEAGVPGSKYVVFAFLEDGEKARQFLSFLRSVHPGMMMSMALVACMPQLYTGEIEGLTSFDYILFQDIESEGVIPVVKYAWASKERSLERERQSRLCTAIYQDMLKMKKIKTEKPVPVKGAGDLYYGVDENGFIRAVNDRVLEILGFSREEVIGRHLSDFIVYSEFKEVKNAFSERRTGPRKSENINMKFRKKDGSYEEFLVDAEGVHIPSVEEHPERDPKRVHIGTIGKARRKFVESHFDLFKLLGLPLVLYEPAENRLVVNRGFEQFSGYSQKEIGDKSPEFFEKAESGYFSCCMKEIFQKKHCVYNTIFVDSSKRERLCEVTFDLIEVNNKPALLGLYNDISGLFSMLDEAEKLIHLSWIIDRYNELDGFMEVATKNLISILNVPFVAISTLDSEKMYIDRVYIQSAEMRGWFSRKNSSFIEDIVPLMNEAITGRKTVYRSFSDVSFTNKQKPKKGKKAVSSLERFFLKSGDGTFITAPLEVNNVPIGSLMVYQLREEGYPLRRIRLFEMSANVIAAGINKLKLERELQNHLQTLELKVKERTRELEDFIYTVSHDLKSPLHAARGFANMIRKQFDSSIRSRDDEFILRRVEENVNQAIKMLDDLLQLSRIGTKEPGFEVVDLAEIIKNYFSELNALKQDEKLNVSFEIKGDFPHVRADRGRMIQMFTNIIDNAIRYRKGDSVHITVNGERRGNRLRVVVEDNGQGIEESDLPHVFKIFYRGKCRGKEAQEGSGIGLAIVKRIVEQHQGTVEVKSKAGVGTSVIIELPVGV